MKDFSHEVLSHDPVHGYIPYVAAGGLPPGEVGEQEIIEHPWVQRMRQIHQLQTAWYVYPSAEHSRFEHILGVMHLGSRVLESLYPSLREAFSLGSTAAAGAGAAGELPPAVAAALGSGSASAAGEGAETLPSYAYLDALVRMAGLLHDVGHGPFGHFFDEHFLQRHHLTHETLGAEVIRRDLGPLLERIRRTPKGMLLPHERLSPEQIAFLIVRPKGGADDLARPKWLLALRSLFCGLYTIDNMDFVLRDAYMTGYSPRAFDVDRILHYSFFSREGLTVHSRGLPALVRFLSVRAELFRNVYFHRQVRAIDLELAELFAESREDLFPGNPLEHWDDYQLFTEWSLVVDVARWTRSEDPRKRALGEHWRRFLHGARAWTMAAERTLFFGPKDAERTSIFSNARLVEEELRRLLPAEFAAAPLKIDLARHLHRPGSPGPSGGQNFLFDPALGVVRPLSDSELYRQLPVSFRICRVYVSSPEPIPAVRAAFLQLTAPGGADDLTNM